IGAGGYGASAIDGFSSGTGTVRFTASQTGTGSLGSSNPLASIVLDAGAVVVINGDVYANSSSFGSGSSLHVNGNYNGDVTVASGGQFGGNNTLNGDLTVGSGGTVAPGNSVGTINVVGNVTFNSGSTYKVEIDSSGADRLNATGNITINPG